MSMGKYDIVKPGDTLWKLAQKHGIPLEKLIEANPQFRDPSRVVPGQRVNLEMFNPQQQSPLAQAGGMLRAPGMSRLSSQPSQMFQSGSLPEEWSGKAEQAIPEEMLGAGKALGGLGAVAAFITKFPQMAIKMAMKSPTLQGQAGRVAGKPMGEFMGNPELMDAMGRMNPGAARAAASRGPRPPMAETMQPNPVRALNRQGRSLDRLGPELYPGRVTPELANNSLVQGLRQSMLKRQAPPENTQLMDALRMYAE